MRNYLSIVSLAFIVFLSGCAQTEIEPINPEVTEPTEQEETDDPIEKGTETNDKSIENENNDKSTEQDLTVDETAETIVTLLKNQDMEALSDFVHPSAGVRFSPYGYVDVEQDQVFTSDETYHLWDDQTVYHWGSFDGSGQPIDLTFPEYYERFVYDEDYANAEEIAVDERLGQGNTLDNTDEVYPGATVVEFHFSGFDEQYEGMDWRSLRLVLKEEDAKWYLVAIIHDEWTI